MKRLMKTVFYSFVVASVLCTTQASDLINAIEDGNEHVARRLIQAGADLTATDTDSLTPLHRACMYGHTEIALALITAGADLTATDRYGSTPLHYVCENGHTETALALIAGDHHDGPSLPGTQILGVISEARQIDGYQGQHE